WNSGQLIAEYVLSELPEEDLIDNQTIVKLITVYKQNFSAHNLIDKNYFIYHSDSTLSTLAVSLLQFPYEESVHCKRELSQSTGYQKSLFEQDYKGFLDTINKNNEEKLMKYLNMGKENTQEE